MLFKQYKVYENKLSEQIDDDNPLKKKLIEMETPTDKHPVYSFLSIGLLVYVWMFLAVLVYKQVYGYEMGIVVVIFTTISFFISYKKTYLSGNNSIYRRNSLIILIISISLSIMIPTANVNLLSVEDIIYEFLFFIEINNSSYLALCILAFLNLGIVLSYAKCPYEIYCAAYSVNKIYNHDRPIKDMIDSYSLTFFIIFITFFWVIYLTLNPSEDDFQLLLKKFSMVYYLYVPQVLVVCVLLKKYSKIYFSYIKNDKYGEKNGTI